MKKTSLFLIAGAMVLTIMVSSCENDSKKPIKKPSSTNIEHKKSDSTSAKHATAADSIDWASVRIFNDHL